MPRARTASRFRPCAGIPSCPTSPTAASAWSPYKGCRSWCPRRGARRPRAWGRRPGRPRGGCVGRAAAGGAARAPRRVLRFLLERYPGQHLGNGGRANPRNEFERYVAQYAVSPREGHELPLRGGDTRPGAVMTSHDVSLCVLCTRCVRACVDIQEVGVLDVAQRGAHTEIIVGGDGDPDHAGCTWCGECVRGGPTGAVFEVMPRKRFNQTQIEHPDRMVRSVCPYCGVGCQIDIHTRG